MTKPRIVPIIEPRIDWGFYVETVIELTGQSPTRQLDADSIRPGPDWTFLKSLESLSGGKGEYLKKHLFYGFMIQMNSEHLTEILKRTKLSIIESIYRSNNDYSILALITGTLYEWREAILEFCIEDVDFVLRYIFDYIYLDLHNRRVLTLYKTMLPDQTFVLELQ